VLLAIVDDVRGGLVSLAPAGLVALGVYVLFWRPCVRVDEDGVTLVNLLRDVRVPFGALEAVGTRFALSLEVSGRRYTAWAAPAPGRTSSMGLARRDAAAMKHLGTADPDEGVRASTAPNTDSGGAALLIQDAWSRWQDRRPSGSGDAVTVRRVTPLVVALVLLLALATLSLVIG
jgi:hypothetical protein